MAGLAGFYAVFFIVAMVLPTLRVWRATGINPLVLPKGDDVAGFVGTWFKLLIALLGLYLLLGGLGLIQPIGPIGFRLIPAIGVGLLGFSLLWVVIAQWQMGAAWRVGIDSANRTDLIARGLFRISRNPIFFGMMVQLLGLFLLQPDAITLSIAVAAYVLISIQIRQEEAHLLALHGEGYAAYRAQVRRWL